MTDCVEKNSKNISLTRILSLQGGGARGFIELVFLSELELFTKCSTYELFDLVGGTSIGGMMAAALTAPDNEGESGRYTATYLRDNFDTWAQNIFKKRLFGGLFGPKYDSDGITKVVDDTFGNLTFDQSLVPTMVPAYDMQANKPIFFKSWRPEQDLFLTADIALATSAAPTYFSPHCFSSLGAVPYTCLDGGIAANDPSYCLTVEAKKLFGMDCRLKIVSLGTGDKEPAQIFGGLENAGTLGWSVKIAEILVDGEMGVTDYLMEKEYGNAYSRWNPPITTEHSSLDSFAPSDLDYFKQVTLEMIEQRKNEFIMLAADLMPGPKE